MAEPLIVERKGSFLHVTFNRPDEGNLFSTAAKELLTDTVDEAGRDEGLRAIVLRGKGEDFCHGRAQKLPGGPPKNAYDAHNRVMGKILGVYKAFRDCPAPIVAVAHGKVLGFGCALVGGADIAYATADARFALPEMSHGTAPTLAMAALGKVTPKVLTDMVLSMREIDAATALAAGLLSRVFPAAEIDGAVLSLLDTLEGCDPIDIRTVKRFQQTGPQLHPDIMADLAGYTLATIRSRG